MSHLSVAPSSSVCQTYNWKGVDYSFRVGRNQRENWALIDAAAPGDVWFHLEGVPSGHVILGAVDNIATLPRQVLKHGAVLCKQKTNKYKSVAKCPVIYTTVSKLTKGQQVGSVLVSGDVGRFVI